MTYLKNVKLFYLRTFDCQVKEDVAVKYNLERSETMKCSFEVYKLITEKSDNRFEYIDGHLYQLASPSVKHQRIVTDMLVEISTYFKNKKCKPFVAPLDLTLSRDKDNINVVQPDILIICDQENIERDKYLGIPTLVVEIISESSKTKDQIKKLDLYRDTGIKEYWIVNPFIEEIYIYTFKNKEIERVLVFNKNETLKSLIFKGLEIKLSQIF